MTKVTPLQKPWRIMTDTRCWPTLGISRWSHSCCSSFYNKFVQCPLHHWSRSGADHQEDPHSSTCRPWLHTILLSCARALASRTRHRTTSRRCYASLVLSTVCHPSHGLPSCPWASTGANFGALATTSSRSWSPPCWSHQRYHGTHWGHGRRDRPLVGLAINAYSESILGSGTPATSPDPDICAPTPFPGLSRYWRFGWWSDPGFWHHRHPTGWSWMATTYRPEILLPHWWEGISNFESSLHWQEAQTATPRPLLGDTPERDTTWSRTG